MKQANIDSVASALIEARKQKKTCRFLLGAGFSVNAGVPLAGQVVHYVQDRYPTHFRGARTAKDHQYPQVMRRLPWQSRYKLFNDFTESASLNWGHVALAWLIRNQFVGRVLTTNFDDLLLRACALFGLHPAVHDLALANLRKPEPGSHGKRQALYRSSLVREPAVFYLHGRHNGFAQMHSPQQVSPQSESLIPVVADCMGGPWVVVGYSGDSDPLFKALQRNAPFRDGFYWVNRDDPSARIQAFLTKHKGTYVRIHDADEFMLRLLRACHQSVGSILDAMLDQPVEVILELQASRKPPMLPRRVTRAIDAAHPGRSRGDSAAVLAKARGLFKRRDHRGVIRLTRLQKQGNRELDCWAAKSCAALGIMAGKEKSANSEILRWFAQAKDLCPSYRKAFDYWEKTLASTPAERHMERREAWRRAFRYYRAVEGFGMFRQGIVIRWARALVTEAVKSADAVKLGALDEAAREIRALIDNDRRNPQLCLLLSEVQSLRAIRSRKPRSGLLKEAQNYRRIYLKTLPAPAREKQKKQLLALLNQPQRLTRA